MCSCLKSIVCGPLWTNSPSSTIHTFLIWAKGEILDIHIAGASCAARPDASHWTLPPRRCIAWVQMRISGPLCHNIPFGLVASRPSLTFDRKVILMDPRQTANRADWIHALLDPAPSERQSGSCAAVAAFTRNCHIYTAPGRRFPGGKGAETRARFARKYIKDRYAATAKVNEVRSVDRWSGVV